MRTKLLLPLLLFTATVSFAAEKIVAGPKGGRLLPTTPHKAEFFVNKDRKVEVTFYDAELKPVPVGSRVVTVTAEPKSGRTPLALEKTTSGYVSTGTLPPGDPYRVVVQVRDAPDATPKNFRIDFDLEECGGCKHAEYACTCGH